jgi:protease I
MPERRAVIPTGPGFQDHDVIYTYYRLKEAGYIVDVATAGGLPVTGKYGVSVPLDRSAPACIEFEDLDVQKGAVEKYDIVVLTGGHEAPDRVRQVSVVKEFVKRMDAEGKIVAGLCHGPWIMISAGIMRGRSACAYVGMRDDLINAGADVADEEDKEKEKKVVVDGNMVTCSYYGEVGAFMKTVLEVAEAREHERASRGNAALA